MQILCQPYIYVHTARILTSIKSFSVFFVFFTKKCIEAFGNVTETLQFLPVQKGQGRNEITDESGPGKVDSLLKRLDEAGQPRIIVGKPGSVRGAFYESYNMRACGRQLSRD